MRTPDTSLIYCDTSRTEPEQRVGMHVLLPEGGLIHIANATPDEPDRMPLVSIARTMGRYVFTKLATPPGVKPSDAPRSRCLGPVFTLPVPGRHERYATEGAHVGMLCLRPSIVGDGIYVYQGARNWYIDGQDGYVRPMYSDVDGAALHITMPDEPFAGITTLEVSVHPPRTSAPGVA